MTPTIREVSAISILSARNWNAPPRSAMISITGTGEARVVLMRGWRHVLRLCFDDIENTQLGLKLFSEKDTDKVIDFLDRVEGKVDHVVVHCTHGQSRSPAIARFISERYDLSNGYRLHPTHNRYVCETLVKEGKMTTTPKKKGSFTDGGFLPDDHWLYGAGPIVSGRPIIPPPKKKARHINEGLCKPDDPIYSTRPVVNGRPILKPPKRKPTENN